MSAPSIPASRAGAPWPVTAPATGRAWSGGGWRGTAWIWGVVGASGATLLLTGSVALAALPPLLSSAGYLVWTRPLRHTALVLLFAALTVFIAPMDHDGVYMASGPLWERFVRPVCDFLFLNLSSVTGVGALRFSGAELIYVIMLLVAGARSVRGVDVDAAGRRPGVNVLFAFGTLSFTTILLLEGWGLARGGDFQQSLWQFRQLLWLPVLTGLFSYCLRGPRDLLPVAGVVTAAACVKIAIGVYFLATSAWPRGIKPDFMTGHDDSILYVVVLVIWCAAWLHQPTRRRFVAVLLVWAWVMTGIVLNDRRIAYVSLFAGLGLLYLLLQGRVKRTITRGLLLALPFLCLYLLAARHRTTGIFKPAAELMAVTTEQQDASSAMRDIENYNLIQTLRPHKLLGTGWGHEYNEVNQAYDISAFFAQYKYIAHNSVLWLLSIGGIVGFTLVWLPISIGVFLAARSYAFARAPLERTVAISALVVLVAYTVQAWGDMGTQSATGTLLVAWALAASGKLARHTGAWPAGVRLLR